MSDQYWYRSSAPAAFRFASSFGRRRAGPGTRAAHSKRSCAKSSTCAVCESPPRLWSRPSAVRLVASAAQGLQHPHVRQQRNFYRTGWHELSEEAARAAKEAAPHRPDVRGSTMPDDTRASIISGPVSRSATAFISAFRAKFDLRFIWLSAVRVPGSGRPPG